MSAPAPILIVDDDPDDLVAVAAVLEPLGRTVVEAYSGDEALRRLLSEDFAVIVMDLMMPRLNGFETAALIRQRERSKAIPIIFLTGFDKEEVRFVPGYSADYSDFARKPVDADVLRSLVRAKLL